MKKTFCVIDGNEAAADSAFRTNEICVIYPITPASTMGELADQWSSLGKRNIWDTVPDVVEMQSEAGACGAIHGVLQTGGLATTFTASQGLLLMIPDMFRIAAELTPTVFHVASRTVAYQGMSIYCDHSDVMATRTTGFSILCSSNVQEAHDMALITQAASIKSRVPFVHFFDGFRTSNEVSKIEYLSNEQIKQLIDDKLVIEHRQRRMSAEKPSTRGVVYNADIAFQAREAMNPFYNKVVDVVEDTMRTFTKTTHREYHVAEFFGHPQAEQVIVLMGSGVDTAYETVAYLQKQDEKVGVLQVRLFQPFPTKYFLQAIPKTCKAIAVLDRTKECGAGGEPLYQKIATIVLEAFSANNLPTKSLPKIIGGRYGLIGKEFTPAMVKGIFAELKKANPKNNFSVGIEDDVTHTSLVYDKEFDIESEETVSAIFYGLGADGTVSANKNTMKIIGEETNNYVQGYFIYDAKKAGSKTISHLRFGPNKIRSAYLISRADFIGCHQFIFVMQSDLLKQATHNATFLLNSPYSATEIWAYLPRPVQQTIIDKKIKFYVIDAYKIAATTGMGSRINTIMQTCFFALTNILSQTEAIERIKNSIKKTYATKGEKVIQQNFAAVDMALDNLFQVDVPAKTTGNKSFMPMMSDKAPEFVRDVEAVMLADQGDSLPVSTIPVEGYFPPCTTCWEKRNISLVSPVWKPDSCIQCGRCIMVCPHACVRAKEYDASVLKKAPSSFLTANLRGKNAAKDKRYTLQIYAEDCTGCKLCVDACPVKEKALQMQSKQGRLEIERRNIEFFDGLSYKRPAEVNIATINGVQYLRPFFEFSGACAGCGETPYVKLISQLFGDRMIIGNACGCSSVYGGNLPTSPWAIDEKGYGPAWSSSLFEDNAEFAFGFQLAEDKQTQYAEELLRVLDYKIGYDLVQEITDAPQDTAAEINVQRARIDKLKAILAKLDDPLAAHLASVADYFVKHSIWAIGGDGWAYDIGFGGLDHVIASKRNVNLLVLDTEVYSNTGGQASKASSRGSVAKFTYAGKKTAKKDLGIMAMSYNTAYICSIALGADPAHAIKAIKEAESYNGPALILAYSHCVSHGIDMSKGMQHQMLAVKTGYWPLYRYDPRRIQEGLNPLQLDSAKPSAPFAEFAQLENRYRILRKTNPEDMQQLIQAAQQDINQRWKKLEKMSQ